MGRWFRELCINPQGSCFDTEGVPGAAELANRKSLGFRFLGLGFRFRVQCLGFRVQCLGFRVWGLEAP